MFQIIMSEDRRHPRDDEHELRQLEEILQVSVGDDQRPWYRPGPAKLLDHLYLGDYSDADSLGLLKELGITHVLNCAGAYIEDSQSLNMFLLRGDTGILAYHQFEADDTRHYKISQHFQEAVDFIETARQKGGKVLVYCAKGINRSAAICVAYMMVHRKTSLLDTVRNVKNQRGGTILSNTGFQRQLICYARDIGCLS